MREVFESILPEAALQATIDAHGMQQRERRLDAIALVRASVIAGARGDATRQASILAEYFQQAGREASRSARYAWFSAPFSRVMASLRERLLAFVAQEKPDLPGLLGAHVSDWWIADSTTVPLDARLVQRWPSTSTGAALKIHKTLSVGVGTVVRYHLSPAREHDSKHLTIDEGWRGKGLLADLAYVSLARLRDCYAQQVHFVVRLKSNWKPRLESLTQACVVGDFVEGSDLNLLLEHGRLDAVHGALDARVVVGQGEQALRCRLVAVEHEKAWHWYLTSLPETVTPQAVAVLYRVRWEVEIDNKVDKSCWQLDEVSARTPETVEALVDAALLGTSLACLLAHRHRMEEVRERPRAKTRVRAPMHPQRTGLMMSVCAMRIALALRLEGDEAQDEWKILARLLGHEGADPNWRNLPSVLDQLRGWKAPKGRRIDLGNPKQWAGLPS